MDRETKFVFGVFAFFLLLLVYVVGLDSYCRLTGNCKGDKQTIDANLSVK